MKNVKISQVLILGFLKNLFFVVVHALALVYNKLQYNMIHKGEVCHGKFINRPKRHRKDTTND